MLDDFASLCLPIQPQRLSCSAHTLQRSIPSRLWFATSAPHGQEKQSIASQVCHCEQ
jgi:hypothetical protein